MKTKEEHQMLWTKVAERIATALVPRIAEELYDYASENINDFREYLADAIKPDKVEEKVEPVKTKITLTVPEIEWIRCNYFFWEATGRVIFGTEVESFSRYCTIKFNSLKNANISYSDKYWAEVARKGVNYYAYPDKLKNNKVVLEHTFPNDTELHLLPNKYYQLTGYNIEQIQSFRNKRRFS